jgi:hypothetical protein
VLFPLSLSGRIKEEEGEREREVEGEGNGTGVISFLLVKG